MRIKRGAIAKLTGVYRGWLSDRKEVELPEGTLVRVGDFSMGMHYCTALSSAGVVDTVVPVYDIHPIPRNLVPKGVRSRLTRMKVVH